MTRVFIYGGCASRDAVRYYPSYGMELVGYVARQSLPSAFAPADLSHFTIPSTMPKFQQRMIRGDIESSLPRTLLEKAPQIDLLIWDLNIERVGFTRLRNGGIITRNGVTSASNQDLVEGDYQFGTDRHFELWEAALIRFVALLREVGLFTYTLVNATPWAATSELASSETHWDAKSFNKLVSRYWNRAEEAGLKLIRVPANRVIADPQHKWGPAFFHYLPQTYKTQVKLIAKAAGLKRAWRIPTRGDLINLFDRHV